MIKHLKISKTLKNWQINLLLFIALSIGVFFIEYFILSPVLKQGLTADDWQQLFKYKTYGPSHLSDVLTTWRSMGPYTTSHFYYVGILESLFGINYQAFQITNVFFKALSTLLLFPLVLVFFKRRILACLATLLYAISHSSTGSLQYVLYGTEYIAISSMLIFLIAYYYTFKNRKPYHLINKFNLLIPPALLVITFLLSPIRIYPLLVLLVLVEVFLLILFRTTDSFKKSLIILGSLFLPIFLVSTFVFGLTSGYLNGPTILYHEMIKGNWQLILTPFSGLGYLFLTDDSLKLFGLFGQVDPNSNSYSLLMGLILSYAFFTILISFILSKNPKRFFLSILLTNLFLDILFFWTGYIQKSIYSASFGIYIFVVGFFTFSEWLGRKKDILLLTLTAGIVFSCIFLWSTWLILGHASVFNQATHRYLVMPSLGSSIFTAVLLVIFYDKYKQIKFKGFKEVIIILILILLYQLSYREINRHFDSLLAVGAGAKEQQFIQGRIINALKKNNYNPFDPEPVLFYFESEDLHNTKFYEVTLDLGYFWYWVHLQRSLNPSGCVGSILSKKQLRESIVTKDNQKGFIYDGICVEDRYKVGQVKVFYDPENFYAFKLRDRDIFDIKKDLLKDLGF